MMMEFYKERGVNPFGDVPDTHRPDGCADWAVFMGLIKVIKDPNQIVQFAYAPLQTPAMDGAPC
jgi:hypothetical protein